MGSLAVCPDSPTFWKEVAATPGGEEIAICVQCNTCTSSCPVEVLEPDFNIRQLVARVKLGLREDVLDDPLLWACVRCHACVAHCPKHVNPGEIVEALRYIALREGKEGPGPRHAKAFAKSVLQNGRIHEAGVTIDSIGWRGMAAQGVLAVQMLRRGKAPSLRPHPLKSIREVQALIAAAGEME